MKYLATLGVNPKLSLAELGAIYPDTSRHSTQSAVFTGSIYPHLGGTSKIGEIITTLNTADINAIADYLYQKAAEDLNLKATKFNIGLSFYGKSIDNYQQISLTFKKHLRNNGLKPRIILAKNQELSSAQVIHNNLIGSGYELLISIGDSSTVVAKTTWVQDIDKYTHRDIGRPCRDMQTGMLPPKLAQIMINITGNDNNFIFDPFCGSGVILQEALLMNKDVGGSDISDKMVNCSRENLGWLSKEFNTSQPKYLEVADARNLQLPEGVDTIVSEGYLGPIINKETDKNKLLELASQSSELMKSTLKNLQPQLPKGSRACLALPAWKNNDNTILPDIIDNIEELGYNRLLLNNSDTGLLYRRDNQFVGRYIILLETR
ncbi:MAG: DNA methyltransferase [Candidatus Saccharimonadales bacterium]